VIALVGLLGQPKASVSRRRQSLGLRVRARRGQARVFMYAKWEKIVVDDDDDDDASLAQKFDPVAISNAARKRVEEAKAEGRVPAAMDVMASQTELNENASKALSQMPESVKQQFLDRLNQPELQKALQQDRSRSVDPVMPAEPRAQDGIPALELLSKGIKLVGKRVVLNGLKSQPGLNGKVGQCIQYVEDKGRCAVLLDGHDRAKLFKMENLEAEDGVL
jgi:glycosyltransferase involved in cell wall biosynthesis